MKKPNDVKVYSEYNIKIKKLNYLFRYIFINYVSSKSVKVNMKNP